MQSKNSTRIIQIIGSTSIDSMGFNKTFSKADFERMSRKESALFVGSSQQIIEKILTQYELFGHQRFITQMDIGGMPLKKVAKNMRDWHRSSTRYTKGN
jgi:hypothetical protein